MLMVMKSEDEEIVLPIKSYYGISLKLIVKIRFASPPTQIFY